MQNEDIVQVRVRIDGKQGINELGKLEAELNQAKIAAKGLKRGTDEFIAAQKNIDTANKRIKEHRTALGLAGMTMQQLTRYQRDLNREMSIGTTRGTARYRELNAELQQVTAAVNRQKLEMKGLNSIWSRLGTEVKQFGIMAIGYLGLTTLTQQIGNLISRAGDLSDQMASVSKTTGLLDHEVEELSNSFKNLNTRTARKELLEMAKIAGKLGITGRNDIIGFVSAADKINVALGEDLGDPEMALRELGKLVETFKVKEVYGIEQSLLKVGSALNTLGMKTTANEGYMVGFTKRMGGIAPLAKITIQEILGLAASSDALGLTQEVTTTALSKLFLKMTTNKDVFAKYAQNIDGSKMSAEQFSNLIDTNFNEAFMAMLRGVKDNSSGMVELAGTLGDLEVDGGRVVQVLGTLANNTGLITQQQNFANKAFKDGTSVIEEYNLMNETLGASLDRIRKALFGAFVNSSLISGLESLVGWMDKLIKVPVSEVIMKERDELNALVKSLIRNNDNQIIKAQIIDELQGKYPDFLKNMNLEKLTAEELNKQLEAVNTTYREKISMQIIMEELEEKERARFIKTRELRAAEEKEAGLKARVGRGGPSMAVPGQAPNQDRINLDSASGLVRRLNDEIGEIDIELSKLELEKQAIDARIAKITVVGSADDNDDADSGDGIQKSIGRPKGMDIMQNKTVELKNDLQTLLGIHIDFERELERIAADGSERRRIIAQMERTMKREATTDMLNDVSGLFGSLARMQDENDERGIQRQRDYLNAQAIAANAAILINQGVSLSNAIKGATEFAASTGPASIFIIGPAIAAMVGTVIGAFASIKRNNMQARNAFGNRNSQQPRGNSQQPTGTALPGYYHGGWTGTQGMGFGDEYGEYAGYVHKREHVLSALDLQSPKVVIPTGADSPPAVVDVSAINSTASAGLRFGMPGSTGTAGGGSVQLDAAAFAKAVDKLDKAINVLQMQGIPAYFSRDQYRRAHEDFEEKNRTADKSRL